jgi:hypothetical protein
VEPRRVAAAAFMWTGQQCLPQEVVEADPSEVRAAVNCTYNVTLRRVRVTIVTVEKQLVLHILSVRL